MSRKRPNDLQNFYDAIHQINIQDLEPRGEIITEDDLNYNLNLIEIYSKQKEDLDQIKFDELELKKSKCEQILKTLISRKHEYERRPHMLYQAARNGNLELVRKLIKENVHLENSIDQLIYPMREDTDINVQFQIISDLLYTKAADVSDKPVILNATAYNCYLFQYSEDKRIYLYKIIKSFLRFGADPNQLDKGFNHVGSPLYFTIGSGQFHELTRLLIENGADVNYKFPEYFEKDTSILKTSLLKDENQEEALLLIEKGADPNFGNPLLMICNMPSYIQVIQQLLKAGADPNVGNPIEKICKTRGVNCLDILKELLKAGANPNNQICFEQEDYWTDVKKVHPIRVAFHNDNYHYLEVLFQASIKLDINDKLLLRDIEVVVKRILQKPKQEQGNYLNFMSRVGYCDIVFDTIDKRLIFETFTRPYIIEELARTRLQPDNISYISKFL